MSSDKNDSEELEALRKALIAGEESGLSQRSPDEIKQAVLDRHQKFEVLRAEIAKGWDAPDSAKYIGDIIAMKKLDKQG